MRMKGNVWVRVEKEKRKSTSFLADQAGLFSDIPPPQTVPPHLAVKGRRSLVSLPPDRRSLVSLPKSGKFTEVW